MTAMASLFRTISSGVYVIGVTDGHTRDAFTASSIVHVSYQPLVIAVAVNPEHAAHALLLAGRIWTASVLDANQLDLAARFGTPLSSGADKMRDIDWGVSHLGAPFLSSAAAYFDCRLSGQFSAGDHQIIVGQVMDGKILHPHAVPLLYRDTGDLDRSSQLYPTHFE